MTIDDLRKQGWTIAEIAEEVGYHPATISKWLKSGGPPGARVVGDDERVLNARWQARIVELIDKWPRLLGVSVHNRLTVEGFEGGYSTVTAALREIRGPRFAPADRVSVPIHTDPGEEAQFDFCDLSDWAQRWGWSTPLFCFGMILCWSRWRLWWFTTSQDRHHTFEGMVRFFEAAGGIPAACRTDRMGALGRSQGVRFVLHAPTVEFAAHHRTRITSCKARDAKRKGKVERPFRQLQQTFLPELEIDGAPASLGELNARAAAWLDERVHAVASRATGERPDERLRIERGFSTGLPAVRFDTDYVDTRRVHNIWPFVTVDGRRYSVPPQALNQLVEIRRRVGSDRLEIRSAGKLIIAHTIDSSGRGDVWDPEHRRAAEKIAMADKPIRHLRAVPDDEPVPTVERLVLGGDVDVDVPDLAGRYANTIEADGEELA